MQGATDAQDRAEGAGSGSSRVTRCQYKQPQREEGLDVKAAMVPVPQAMVVPVDLHGIVVLTVSKKKQGQEAA